MQVSGGFPELSDNQRSRSKRVAKKPQSLSLTPPAPPVLYTPPAPSKKKKPSSSVEAPEKTPGVLESRAKLPKVTQPAPAPNLPAPVSTVPRLPKVVLPGSGTKPPIFTAPKMPRAGPIPSPAPSPAYKSPMEGGRKPRAAIPGGSAFRSRIARNSMY
jgi:hypothetical protein